MADIEHLRQLIRGLDHDLRASQRECRELRKTVVELNTELAAAEVRRVQAQKAGLLGKPVSDKSPVQETRGDLIIG